MAYIMGSMISSVMPANGSSDVALDVHPTVTFLLDMDPETITPATIVLLDEASNKVEAQVTYADRIATIIPVDDLTPSSRYQIIIKGGMNGVKNLSGSILLSDFSSNFETTSKDMLQPPLLLTPTNDSRISSSQQFTWSAIDGATSYRIVIAEDYRLGTVIFDTIVSTTSIVPDVDFAHNKIYYWRVMALSETSAGKWSQDFSFRYLIVQEGTQVHKFDIVSILPAPDKLAVNGDSIIQAIFTLTVDPDTVDDSTFVVTAETVSDVGEPEEVAGTISIDKNTIEFTPQSPLLENRQYTITISRSVSSTSKIPLDDDMRWSFCTKFSPYYSSVAAVRNTAGTFIDAIPDPDIARTIHDVSLWADHIAARPYGSRNTDFPGKYRQQTDNKRFYHDYVRYESALRVVTRAIGEHAPNHGETRQIGDLTIKHAGSMAPDINMVIKKLERARDKAEHYLKFGEGTSPLPTVAVKGQKAYPYPLSPRNSF